MEDLSKRKYIYRIYASEDRVIHCERHPVIYINSMVVYYKDHRKQEYLNYRLVSGIEDKFIAVDLGYYNNYEKYFWIVENFDSKTETEKAFSLKTKNDIEKAKEAMDRAAKEYEAKKQKYYSLVTK